MEQRDRYLIPIFVGSVLSLSMILCGIHVHYEVMTIIGIILLAVPVGGVWMLKRIPHNDPVKINERFHSDPSLLESTPPDITIDTSLRSGGLLMESDILRYSLRCVEEYHFYYNGDPSRADGQFTPTQMKIALYEEDVSRKYLTGQKSYDEYEGRVATMMSFPVCHRELQRINTEHSEELFSSHSVEGKIILSDVSIPQVEVFYRAMGRVENFDSHNDSSNKLQEYAGLVRDLHISWEEVKNLISTTLNHAATLPNSTFLRTLRLVPPHHNRVKPC